MQGFVASFLLLIISLIALRDFANSLTCYHCFHAPLMQGMLPEDDNTSKSDVCTKTTNCTTQDGVCLMNENTDERRYSAICITLQHDALVTIRKQMILPDGVDAEITLNGCWKDSKNDNENFCICTKDFCNDIRKFDDGKEDGNNVTNFPKFETKSAETHQRNENKIDNKNADNNLDKEVEVLRKAIEASKSSNEEIDAVPMSFEDYEEFTRNQSMKSDALGGGNITDNKNENAALGVRFHTVLNFISFAFILFTCSLLY